MLTANGKVIFVENEKINNPFIYRGNLSNTELRAWLRDVEHALEMKDSSATCAKELNLEIERMKKKEAERNEFISASVYPRDPDPIQSHGSQDIGKQTGVNHSHENCIHLAGDGS